MKCCFYDNSIQSAKQVAERTVCFTLSHGQEKTILHELKLVWIYRYSHTEQTSAFMSKHIHI